jgi:Fe-S cluster biogenesis protein NfuA
MSAREHLRSASDRIEALVEELRAGEGRCAERAEELLALVCELYGAGLQRVVELVGAQDGALLARLADDDVIASLLLVHGLHPLSVPERVQRALASVRPLLASHGGDVELVALDPAAGALQLRLLGSCDGCPASSITLRLAVEKAVVEAAPEVVRIDLVEASPPPPEHGTERGRGAAVPPGSAQRPAQSTPIALRTRPAYDRCPSEQMGA